MIVGFVISIGYLAIYVFYLGYIFVLSKNKDYSKKRFGIILFVLALAFFGCCINPPSNGWDLYRHYEYIDTLRISGYKFMDYMFNYNNLLGGGSRSGLYGYKLLCYVVAILGNNRILPFVTIATVYFVWAYISINWLAKHNAQKLMVPALLFCVSWMPFVYVNTGIRNALAASLVAIAIYQELVYRKSTLLTAGVLLFACTIHNAVILVLPCWILAHFKFKIKSVLVMAFGLLLIDPVAQVAYQYGPPSVAQAAHLYLVYKQDSAYFFSYGYLVIDIATIVMALVCVYNYTSRKSSKESEQETRLYNFFTCYVIVIAAQIGHYDLVLRPMYVMAAMSGPMVYWLYKEVKSKKMQQLIYLLSICFFFVALAIHGPAYILMSYC